MNAQTIAFIDLAAQRKHLDGRIEAAIARVVEHGAYIMGPEVAQLEQQLAAYVGVRHAVSCASGTDALLMVLMAHDIGPGNAVFVPAFTFAATAEVVALLGATPVFVDVGDDFNMDPGSLERAIEMVDRTDLRGRGVIPVDLFGLPADYEAIEPLAQDHGLFVLQDAAQSFGGRRFGKTAGAHAHAAATSFYPAKPLGCYGDGGAVFTDDENLADKIRSLRIHGMGQGGQYDNVRIGITGRLDTIQAAVLIEKLAVFDAELAARGEIACRYHRELRDVVRVPPVPAGVASAWAQYTIVLPCERAAFAAALKAQGVPTAVYYPRSLARQPAYMHCPVAPGGLPKTDAFAERVISLPMHPYLEAEVQERIIGAVQAAVAEA